MNTVDPKSLLDCLWSEVVWLDNKWLVCQSLFGTKIENLDTLNRRTGSMFWMFQTSLIDAIILSITKMLDPAKSYVKKSERLNATFYLMLESLPVDVDASTRTNLANQIMSLKIHSDVLIQRRNRSIAHHDWKTASKEEPLDEVTFKTIIDAIALLKNLMNEFGRLIDDTTYMFDMPSLRYDAETLIRVVKLGNDVMDAEQEAKRRRFAD